MLRPWQRNMHVLERGLDLLDDASPNGLPSVRGWNIIGGHLTDASDGGTLESRNPADLRDLVGVFLTPPRRMSKPRSGWRVKHFQLGPRRPPRRVARSSGTWVGCSWIEGCARPPADPRDREDAQGSRRRDPGGHRHMSLLPVGGSATLRPDRELGAPGQGIVHLQATPRCLRIINASNFPSAVPFWKMIQPSCAGTHASGNRHRMPR